MDWLTSGRTKRLISQLSDSTKRERAAQELIRLSAEAAPVLIKALQTSDLNLLPLYAQILVRIGSPATPALTSSLATAHPLVRAQVCDILGQIKDRASMPALLDALRGEFYTVRAKSAAALGNIGDPQATQQLLTALKDKEDDVRASSALALGKFNNPAAFDDIADLLLDDPKLEVRQAAARAFGETKNSQSLPYLMQALRDSFWWFERDEQSAGDLLQAIENMGWDAVDPLIEALNDPEGTVRKFAADLLGRIGDERAIESLGMAIYDLHLDVGHAAAESLASFGAAALGVLGEALQHPEAGIRLHAIWALTKIKDVRVLPILAEMLKDPDRHVLKQVVQSLGELGDPRTLAILTPIADDRGDRELSMLAREAMKQIQM